MAIVYPKGQRPEKGPGFDPRKRVHDDLARWTATFVGARATLKGYRGAREVNLGPAYVADSVFVAALQGSVCRRYGVLCPTVSPQLQADNSIKYVETDELGADYTDQVLVFEAKQSRSDFLATFSAKNFQNRAEPAGNLHWVVTTKGLVKPEEVPGFWGLLEECATGLREKKRPTVQKLPLDQLYRIGYGLLWKKNYHRDFYEAPKPALTTNDANSKGD